MAVRVNARLGPSFFLCIVATLSEIDITEAMSKTVKGERFFALPAANVAQIVGNGNERWTGIRN
jgi:hypothetical protein